jgi:release factor glutamine methyltransferase
VRSDIPTRATDLLPHLLERCGSDAIRVAIQLQAHTDDPLAAANRVADGEPLALVLGTAEFAGLSFFCTPGVFTPRPSTLNVIARAAVDAAFTRKPAPIVVDIGTGTGVIAIVLAALSGCGDFIGVDLDHAAVELARQNAAALVPELDVVFSRGDVRDHALIASLPAAVDVLVCNPPYIPTRIALPEEVTRFQPAEALYSGPDGMEVVRACLRLGESLVTPGGLLLLEHDPAQGGIVRALAAGLANFELADRTGHPAPYTALRRREAP